MRRYKCLRNQEFKIESFSIRPVNEFDIEAIRFWRNGQLDVLRQKRIISKEDQINYFTNYVWPLFEEESPTQILFSFFDGAKFIGYGGLVHLSWEDKRAEMSFLVDPEISKKKEAYSNCLLSFIQLMKKVLFDELKFHRLFTETYEIRDFHISILEKGGFELEGSMRDHVIIDGKFSNSLIHSIIKKEHV